MRNRLWLGAALVALSLVAAGCGGGGGGSDLTGEIFISGSSTVEPISALVAELWGEENPGVAINVEGPGTGDGFELFCNGETDISDASRPIDPEDEVPACEANGVESVELEVAIDGMAVLTSPENTQVQCLNFADLYALLGPESQGFDSWSDATPLGEEVGGTAVPYPEAELNITAPGEESGTYDSFVEIALSEIAEERGQPDETRPDYQASGNDNVIIEGIAGSDTSLGWVGYAFFVQNQDVVRAIPVAEGDGSDCVSPAEQTISGGSYPLQRSLYVYVNKDTAARSEALRSFVDFYMSETGLQTAVTEVGYVALPADRQAATAAAWEAERPA